MGVEGAKGRVIHVKQCVVQAEANARGEAKQLPWKVLDHPSPDSCLFTLVARGYSFFALTFSWSCGQ